MVSLQQGGVGASGRINQVLAWAWCRCNTDIIDFDGYLSPWFWLGHGVVATLALNPGPTKAQAYEFAVDFG